MPQNQLFIQIDDGQGSRHSMSTSHVVVDPGTDEFWGIVRSA